MARLALLAHDSSAEDAPCAELSDTPGLEDAIGLRAWIGEQHADAADPQAAIEAFLGGDHAGGRYEQEARVLREMLSVDAALYVIDAREPLLAKHGEELKLLADCGRPMVMVLNFTAAPDADPQRWHEGLRRFGQHRIESYDTQLPDFASELRLFEDLARLLPEARPPLQTLVDGRRAERAAQCSAAARRLAELLVDAAGLRARVAPEALEAARNALRARLRKAEQRCVEDLLAIFRFEAEAVATDSLPLDETRRWEQDLFDPAMLSRLGLESGSTAAAGAGVGLVFDSLSAGLSLGAGTAVGAGVGALVGAVRGGGGDWLARLRGQRLLATDPEVLYALATRQLLLIMALLLRGHAATAPLALQGPEPIALPPDWLRLLRRARSHPQWSAMNGAADRLPGTRTSGPGRARLLEALTALISRELEGRDADEAPMPE